MSLADISSSVSIAQGLLSTSRKGSYPTLAVGPPSVLNPATHPSYEMSRGNLTLKPQKPRDCAFKTSKGANGRPF